jgi:hypothetical protein
VETGWWVNEMHSHFCTCLMRLTCQGHSQWSAPASPGYREYCATSRE